MIISKYGKYIAGTVDAFTHEHLWCDPMYAGNGIGLTQVELRRSARIMNPGDVVSFNLSHSDKESISGFGVVVEINQHTGFTILWSIEPDWLT
jgi:hypothetical protein